MDLEAIEKKRESLQSQLDSSKSQEDRNQNGQFATPYELSRQLMIFAKNLLSDAGEIDFLEPAVGTGPFLSALFSTFTDWKISQARGIEKDVEYVRAAQQIWKDSPVKVSEGDFTKLSPPTSEEERFNLLVTNPPYVRHHHLESKEKERLQRLASEVIGESPSGYTGLYCYFMYLAHNWLREGGVAGWLVPTEFTEVGYGKELRRYLLDEVTLLRVHQYRPEDLQFDSALVSSCVVWYRKEKPRSTYKVDFSFGGTHTNPDRVLSLSSSTLADLQKWNLLSLDNGTANDGHPTVDDLFEIKRGIATGSNDFFILEEEQIEDFDLPDRFLKPILPSPRYLDETIIGANDDGSPNIEKRLWLLSCNLTEDAVRENYSNLWRYLQRGKEQGVHEGYLCRNRSVWYHQEHRDPAPFLCKYMGRESFGFFLNRSDAIASNNLTMMYPNSLLEAAIGEDSEFKEKLILLLSEISESAMRQGGRTYGGGMTKVEPGELEEIPVPGLKDLLSETAPELAEKLEDSKPVSLF